MKKLSLAVLLGVALCAAMTGCDNTKNDTTPPAASTNAPAAPAAPAGTNAAP